MSVQDKIKYFREKQNLSVNRLAQIANLSQSGLREIEKGIKQPTIITLEKICDALGISIIELFDEHQIEKPNTTIADVIKDLENLTQSELESLHNLIRTFKG